MTSKHSRPFLGGVETTFLLKYPQVKSLHIEYEQMENRLDKDRRRGSLNEHTIRVNLSCNWGRCNEGGFPIEDQIISRMLYKQTTDLEGTLACTGHEKLGRNIQGSDCTNYLKFKAHIVYHDPAPTESKE